MLQLIPAIEVFPWDPPLSWASSVDGLTWIELSASTSFDDVSRVVARIAGYGAEEIPASAIEAAEALASGRCSAVAGGLIVRAASFQLVPGCCCGLEDWREWLGVIPGVQSPWLGHDPAPWIECLEDVAVIWADGGVSTPHKPPQSLRVNYKDIRLALGQAREDLEGFLSRLIAWCDREGAPRAAAHEFDRAFSVTQPLFT